MYEKKNIIISIFLIALLSLISCVNSSHKLKFVSFKNYSLKQTDFNLGLGFYEGCEMNIVQNKSIYTIYVTFNNTSDFLGEHIKGDYTYRNDTIFLGWEYVRELDQNRNLAFYDAKTIIYEYQFIVDTSYTFIFLDTLTNCNVIYE